MAIGVKFKRSKIADYMDTHFSDEIFEVTEDLLAEKEPSIKLLTKNREVVLSCDENGQVQEEFKMADGADSEEFSLKKQAYIALNTFLGINYPDAIIIKDSFENSVIKLEFDNKNVALSYDFDNKTVVRKERAKKGSALLKNDDIEGQMSLFDMGLPVTEPVKESKKAEEAEVNADKTEDETVKIVTKSRKPKKKDILTNTTEDVAEKEPEVVEKKEEKVEFIRPANSESKSYSEIIEGTVVKSIYSDKKYTVLRDRGSMLKVRDKDGNSFEMARSDTVIYVEEPVVEQ